MVGSRRASMVFPAPGGPISRMLWAAGRGDLEGPLGGGLAADVGEVHGIRNAAPP